MLAPFSLVVSGDNAGNNDGSDDGSIITADCEFVGIVVVVVVVVVNYCAVNGALTVVRELTRRKSRLYTYPRTPPPAAERYTARGFDSLSA